MIVVPDAGPLIYLGGAGHLELLRLLFHRVVVPRIVFDEVVGAGAGQVGAPEVAAATWLEVQDAEPDALLAAILYRGEAAAIPLAAKLGAVLLCDDAAGRIEARRRQLRVVGTLGVLLLAKEHDHLAEIKPVLETMRTQGMYVSEALVREVLSAAEEPE